MKRIGFGFGLGIAALAAVCVAVALPAVAGDGSAAPVRYEKDKGISEPVVVNKVTPAYPEEAKKERVQGTVIVDATVDVEGKVVEAKVSKGADPRLDKAALDAVRKWTYKPARDAKGKPVAVIFTVTIRFALQ